MRSQNKVCLDATYKAWEVPFPAIWQAFLAKLYLYATRQPMVALRLDSITYYPLSAPGNPPSPLCTHHNTPQPVFRWKSKVSLAPPPPPFRPNPGSATEGTPFNITAVTDCRQILSSSFHASNLLIFILRKAYKLKTDGLLLNYLRIFTYTQDGTITKYILPSENIFAITREFQLLLSPTIYRLHQACAFMNLNIVHTMCNQINQIIKKKKKTAVRNVFPKERWRG